MTRTILLLLCLGIAGCVSVPLSTLVRMSSFGVRDFIQLNPDVLRVRIRLPQGFALDAAKSSLDVSIASPAGAHHGAFKLDQDSTAGTRLSAGLFSDAMIGTAYTLRLSGASKEAFRQLQSFVGRGPPGEITLRVVPILSSFPEEAPSVKVWIDLLLSGRQGYFTLVDGAEVPMDKIREASTAR